MSITQTTQADGKQPFMAQWAERTLRPQGSTDMTNPDTSTYNKSTEDSDT
jgi:hypothetical protein